MRAVWIKKFSTESMKAVDEGFVVLSEVCVMSADESCVEAVEMRCYRSLCGVTNMTENR